MCRRVNIPEGISRYFVIKGAYFVYYIALWYIECFICNAVVHDGAYMYICFIWYV